MANNALTMIPEGCVILKEGELNLDMYKIVHGHAEVYTGYGTDKEVLIGILGPGRFFGEFGMLLGMPALYTIVAFSEICVMRIREDNFYDFIQHNHKDIIEVMRNMSRMMVSMQQQIDLLSGEIGELVEDKKKQAEELAKDNLRDYVVASGRVRLEGKMRYFCRSI